MWSALTRQSSTVAPIISQFNAVVSQIHQDAALATSSTLPAMVVRLETVVNSFGSVESPFHLARLEACYASRGGSQLVLESENKKRKFSGEAPREMVDPFGPETCERVLRFLGDAFEILEAQLDELVAIVQGIQRSLTLRVCRDEAEAEAVEECVVELGRALEAANGMTGSAIKFYDSRATYIQHVHNSSQHLTEYSLSLIARDREALRRARQQLIDVYDISLVVYTAVSKI